MDSGAANEPCRNPLRSCRKQEKEGRLNLALTGGHVCDDWALSSLPQSPHYEWVFHMHWTRVRRLHLLLQLARRKDSTHNRASHQPRLLWLPTSRWLDAIRAWSLLSQPFLHQMKLNIALNPLINLKTKTQGFWGFGVLGFYNYILF